MGSGTDRRLMRLPALSGSGVQGTANQTPPSVLVDQGYLQKSTSLPGSRFESACGKFMRSADPRYSPAMAKSAVALAALAVREAVRLKHTAALGTSVDLHAGSAAESKLT